MANKRITPLDQVADAYNLIHTSILTAVAATADSKVVAAMMADDKAAYAAYKRAMLTALNPNDPVMVDMLGKLKAATDAIEVTESALKQIEKVAANIDKAVGVISKIAVLLA